MLPCLWAFGLCVGVLSGLSVAVDAISPVVVGLLALVMVAGIAAAGWLFWRRRPVLAGLLACTLLGVIIGGSATLPQPLPDPLPALLEQEDGGLLQLQGRWLRTIRYGDGPNAVRGLLRSEHVAGVALSCQVAVTVAGAAAPPQPGDRISFRARVSPPWGLRNPGMPDAALAARAQGIDLLAWVPPAQAVSTLQPGVWWGPRRLAQQAHFALARAIEAVVPPARSPLVKALVLGERTAAGADVEAGFKAAGAVHALSVSGLHLTAVAGALFLLLRQLVALVPGLARRVRPPVMAAALAIPALLFYCAITGEATATRRAALMAALGFGAVLVGRLPSLAAAIGTSAFVLLLDSPLLLLDASFQLSFSSVMAVALAGRNFQPLHGVPWWHRALVWVGRGLLISTAAFVATAPLASHHFAELAPASPLGNLVLVPPVELGIVPLGLLGASLGALWWPLGYVPLVLADWLCRLTLLLAAGFRRWAPVVPVPGLDGFEATTLFLAALLLLLLWGGGRRDRRTLILAGLAAAAGVGHLGWRVLQRRLDDGVQVTFLDVGQGDAALIEAPGGFVALIDGGGTLDGQFDPGARVIEPVLRRKLIGRLDLVVLSHPHPDHMNGLFRVLERFEVDTFWSAGDGAGNPEYDRLVTLARSRGIEVAAPHVLARGGFSLEPLGPYLGDAIGAPPGLEANDASLVVQLGFAGRRVLFTGDIEAQGEAELLGRHGSAVLATDVLKVPHHGSRTSSSEELLSVTAPARAVFSLGRRNQFGFPRAEVLRRYQQHQVNVLRTDWHGAITVAVSADGALRATCARGCR